MTFQFKDSPASVANQLSKYLEYFPPSVILSGGASEFTGKVLELNLNTGKVLPNKDMVQQYFLVNQLFMKTSSQIKRLRWAASEFQYAREFEDIISLYREEISKVSEVQQVARAENVRKVSFVTVVDDIESEVLLDKVYPVQESLERKYPHWVFEFHYIEPGDLDYIELDDKIELERTS